ncbi:hypothetical protein VUR80DRAFT_9467 [Thermomyces stellatus]
MSAGFKSSNPFRRNGNAAALNPNPNSIPPAHSTAFDSDPFSSNVSFGETPADAAEPGPPKRKKVVKRVRVQTPPPLSSDSESDGSVGMESPIERKEDEQDPFEAAQAESPVDVPTESGPPRRNPFSKTLQDIEPGQNQNEGKASARGPGRASLDVAAFSRLLLTGQASANNAGASSPAGTSSIHTPPGPDTESDSSLLHMGRNPVDPHHNTNANPAPTEPPKTRSAEPEAAPLIRANKAAGGPKKKPPPPSPRHGKAIRIQLGGDDKARQQPAPPTPPLARTPSDTNKPLPPAPLRSPEEEEAVSVFDREAAGRVPEGSEPPSPAVSGSEVQGVAKRVTPAPPPRRNRDGGGRVMVASAAHVSEPQRRGSMESTHSRTESIRQPAPTPPPPRRPAHRSTSSITSPSSQSFAASRQVAPEAGQVASPRSPVSSPMNPKLAPPPPPARNASTRRKTTNNSIDSSKRGSKDREAAPPPPPRRQRGGSRSSLDSMSEGSKRVGENGAGVDTLQEEDEVKMDDGQASAILADLQSLQREVDALQKQYANASR